MKKTNATVATDTAQPAVRSSSLLADLERRVNEARSAWMDCRDTIKRESRREIGLWRKLKNRKREYEAAQSANS